MCWETSNLIRNDSSTLRNKMKPSSALQSTQPLDVNPDTEALLAAELNKLSMQERDEMLQDIHGVSDVLAENPDRVERCFAMLRDALSVFPAHRKMAYSRARTIDPAKVDQNEFLLMFLRAYSFDIGATATAVVTFFETKMELFGPEKLTKDIGYEDLDEDDIRCLESGYIQVLPVRDRAGRAIIWFMPTIVQYRTLLNRVSCSKEIPTTLKHTTHISANSATSCIYGFHACS